MPNLTESSQQPSLGNILRESILQGNTPSLTVISESMSPLLRSGDRVILQKLDRSLLQPGQIITFAYPQEPSRLVTHRLAGFAQIDGQSRIVSWADRTLMFDSPIEMNDIIGRVAWRTRNGQHLNLDNGRGAWLSNKLSNLATIELKWITKLDLVADELNEQSIADSDELRKKGKSNNSVRLLRRITYYWASILSWIVEFLTKLE